MQTIAVVLGAGASHDVWDRASPPADPRWKPPLTRDLFDWAKHPHFYELAHSNGHHGAIHLGAELADNVRRHGTAESLEAQLRAWAQSSNEMVRAWFHDIPQYLRDLLFTCEVKYVRSPSAYITMLKRFLLEGVVTRLVFLVLNYDTLLERALRELGYPIRQLTDYVGKFEDVAVVKLHGSTDWFFPCGNSDDWKRNLAQMDPLVARPGIQMKDMPARGATDYFDGVRFYPALTAPIIAKDAAHVRCPAEHLAAVRPRLQECRKVLFIGTSGLDEDLHAVLKESLPAVDHLHCVAQGDVRDVSQRLKAAIPQLAASARAGESNAGFFEFVFGSDLRDFVRA